MNFNEIKCKFCGASLKVAPGTKEVTCEHCYNSFKLDEEQVNPTVGAANNGGGANTNLPNPFASLSSSSENTPNTINQPAPMNNINQVNQMPNNMVNPGFNNQNIPSNNVPQNIPIMPNNNVQPVQPMQSMEPMQPVQPNIPNAPSMPVQTPNPQVVPVYNEPVSTAPVEQPPLINTPPKNDNNDNNKKKKKKKKNIKKILLYILFIGIMVGSGVIYYLDSTKEPEQPEIYDQLPSEIVVDDKDKTKITVDDTVLNLAPDVDLNHERQVYNNNDIVGRLEIPDLFNVLVTKTTDNSFYLNHDVYRKSDIRGTEFLDYRVNPTSKQVNIYGHNTRDINIKVAFLKLEQFLNKDFFDKNRYIVFQYDGGKTAYKIVAIKEILSDNPEHMYVDKTGEEFVQHVKKMTTGDGVINSRDVYFNEDSSIIVLQTCSHHWDNAFYTVVAVKAKDL